MRQGSISTYLEGGIATVTFSHPSHNSLPSHLLAQLRDAILESGKSDQVHVLLLQSTGDRTFCAGANFKELSQIRSMEAGKEFFLGFAGVINAIRVCEKIVVGRIQGKAVGGGVGLLAACDYTMATKWGSVRLSELTLGIGPHVIEPSIVRKIGRAHFTELALNPSEWQTAKWGRQVGLYQELFDEVNQMDEYLKRYLHDLSQCSQAALKTMKKVLWKGTEHWDALLDERASLSGQLIATDEAQKAVARMLR